MVKNKLFNKMGTDDPQYQTIVGGNPTGIANLNNNVFTWANSLYRVMTGNFWIPEKVPLTDDKLTISLLTEDEDSAVKDTLSFLIFLDSFQCLNLPNVAQYITAPAVANLIGIQLYEEIIHSQSYQYILESLYPAITRDEIYNRWRTEPVLLERIEQITRIGEEFLAEPYIDNYKKVLSANLILESIYFYQGFMFFDQLASRNKLIQTDKIIDYIRRNEITHIGIFIPIIQELFNEVDYFDLEVMIRDAVDNEIKWANHVYGDKILGISCKSSEQYVKFLANDRWQRLGRKQPLYPEVKKNPYAHLEQETKENFFESTTTSYDRSESIQGWDF